MVAAQIYIWSEANKKVKLALNQAKVQVIEAVRLKTGILLDSPISSGGNTINDPNAGRFFSSKERENICAAQILRIEKHLSACYPSSMF